MYKYPYGNSEELNLDWFLNQFQSFTADVQKKLANATVQSIIEYIAGEYDTSKNYSENDYCIYEGSLYRATASTTGAFNSDAWVNVKLSDDITTIWGELTGLTTGLATAQTTASNAATAAANAQTTASNAATAAANAQTTASNTQTTLRNVVSVTDMTLATTQASLFNCTGEILENVQFKIVDNILCIAGRVRLNITSRTGGNPGVNYIFNENLFSTGTISLYVGICTTRENIRIGEATNINATINSNTISVRASETYENVRTGELILYVPPTHIRLKSS